MNGKWPDILKFSREVPSQKGSGDGKDAYPGRFVFETEALREISFDQRSASVLAQLCDVLMIVETSCAQRFTGSTAPIKQCSVFLLEILMMILEEGRQTQRNFTPTYF